MKGLVTALLCGVWIWMVRSDMFRAFVNTSEYNMGVNMMCLQMLILVLILSIVKDVCDG